MNERALHELPTVDDPEVSGARALPRLEEGAMIGRYRVEDVVGVGGQGVVYRGEHFALEYPVAIKVLRDDALTPLQRTRLQREARFGAQVRHPNIVAVLDAGELADGSPYVVMEYVAGRSLWDVLGSERLSPAATVELGLQLLSAITALNEHTILHRDIKPQNIMLRSEVDGVVTAKLFDFGISKTKDDALGGPLTSTGTLVGTPHYMSPEHVLGMELDVRSDLYAVSAVLYECIGGEPPYNAPSTGAVLAKIATEPARPLADLAPACPAVLAAVIDRGLSRERSQRWSHPLEMAEALRRAAHERGLARGADAWTGLSLSAAPVALIRRTPSLEDLPVPALRPRRRWRRIASASSLVLALALGIGAWQLHSEDTSAAASASTQVPELAAPAQVNDVGGADEAATSEPPTLAVPRARPSSSAEPLGGAALDDLERSARAAFVRGDVRRSRALYRRLVVHAPRRASAWRGLGRVGDAATAHRALSRYLELRPNAPDRARVEAELRRLSERP